MVYFKQQTRNDIYCSKELVNIDIFQIANIHVFRNPVLGLGFCDKYITKRNSLISSYLLNLFILHSYFSQIDPLVVVLNSTFYSTTFQ